MTPTSHTLPRKRCMYHVCVTLYVLHLFGKSSNDSSCWQQAARSTDACHDDVCPCVLESVVVVVAYIHVGGAGCQLSRRDHQCEGPCMDCMKSRFFGAPVIRARSFISSPAVFSSQDLERWSVSLHDGSEASFTGSTFTAGLNPSLRNWDFL